MSTFMCTVDRILSSCTSATILIGGLTASVVADDSAGWLNVRDFAVSGSALETTGATTAGSNRIVVKDVGDFQVGQGVMVSECNPRHTKQVIWGPRGIVGWEKKPDGKADIRGYDGTQGDW